MYAGALRETAAGIRGANSTRLTVRNHPLPLTEAESVQLDSVLLVLAALFVLVPFCLLSGPHSSCHACMEPPALEACLQTTAHAMLAEGRHTSKEHLDNAVMYSSLHFSQTSAEPHASCHAADSADSCHAGSYCIAPVSERMSGAMHLQMLSGCPGAIYWLGHYLWDLAAHTTVCIASLIIFWVCSCLWVTLCCHDCSATCC